MQPPVEPVNDRTGEIEEGFSGNLEISGMKDQLISKEEDPVPYFAELAEGTYKVFLSKEGLQKQQLLQLEISATGPNEACEQVLRVPVFEGPLTENVELQYLAETGEFKVRRTLRVDAPVVAGERDVLVYDKQALNVRALFLPAPEYPKSARLMNVKGLVQVEVVIDTEGNVKSAKAISGLSAIAASVRGCRVEGKVQADAIVRCAGRGVRLYFYNFQ